MRITALGMPIGMSPRSNASKNKAVMSALNSKSADIFCFKGGKLLSDKIEIVSSSTPTSLQKSIEKELGIEPIKTDIKKFKNGETYVNIPSPVRGKDVYLMPTAGNNVNDNLMETYLRADAAKRAGANKVIAVMPSFDYARQEKKTEKGEAIAARLNMDLLKASGVDEIISADLHTPALEGFAPSNMLITHLESMPLMRDYFKSKNLDNLIVVSPDLGGTKRADKLAKALGTDKAIIYKHRQAHNEATAEELIGDVKGKNCIIYDDMIDTAGTISAAAEMLKKKGAEKIYVCAAHGLFNGSAMEKLQKAPVEEVIVTNSIEPKINAIGKIKQVDIGCEIARAIQMISG